LDIREDSHAKEKKGGLEMPSSPMYQAEHHVHQEASIQFAYVGATMDSKSGSPIKHDKIKLNPHVF
jgi:hypothetical protein